MSTAIPGELCFHHLDGPPETYILKKWFVQPGDPVDAPQIVAAIESASFSLEIEAFDSGTISEQCFREGQVIPDGVIIARIHLSRSR
ncbi:biotin/lipoyl-containing protein [Luteolibacter soli]|uniref:Biotin/lipoyl-containing protein n=1 Tax=Luteolibacter soli TaxID=3135280 RepID=A0ABU9ATR5_9BACT